ncbi:MAG: hypothetical protein WEB57_09985 [Pseudohongiellaceae bacterium]
MNTLLCTMLAITLGAAAWPHTARSAEISWTGQPDSHRIRMQQADIGGFGPWQFGMSPARLEEQLRATWPDARIRQRTDPVQRTRMITLDLPALPVLPDRLESASPSESGLGAEAPGPATVTFLFGYRSDRLMTINLNWYAQDNANTAQRQALLSAGTDYVAHLLEFYWEPLQSARGHVLGPNNLLLFTGRDRRGRGVEVRIDGVALDVINPDGGEDAQRPAPEGPAQLQISLSARPDDPDVYRVPDFYAPAPEAVRPASGPLAATPPEPHSITGFRSARFGMTLEEVAAAIRGDFGVDDADMTEIVNEEEGTLILQVTVPELAPGPGPAELYYILGAASQRVIHVNVIWSTGENPGEEARNRIGVAGMQLTRYFSERQWKPDGMASGMVTGPGEVVLFTGIDSDNAGVEVMVRGVPTTSADGTTTEPEGPALLRLSYMLQVGEPDVVVLPEDGF